MAERELDIHGPPGAGKTRLLIKLSQAGAVQFGPRSLAVCTFTRAAAAEFRSRIAVALALDPEAARKEVPYVGTIHSLCWRALGKPPITADGGRTFAREMNLEAERWKDLSTSYEPSADEIDALPGGELGPDWGAVKLALACWSGLRHRHPFGDPLPHLGELLPATLPAGESYDSIKDLIVKYGQWKHEKGLYDFEDILTEGRLHTLPVRNLFLDEAQDNSPLLWSVVDAWAQSVHTLFVGGDPYQSIFRFAGASPKQLRDRRGTWVHLREAHRFTDDHADYAKEILRRAGWDTPADEEFHTSWHGVGDSPMDGTTFYLARTHALLIPYRGRLMEDGEPFGELRGKAPLETRAAKAWLLARRYERQELITPHELLQFAEAMPPHTVKYGVRPRLKQLAEIPGLVLGPGEVRQHLGQMTPVYLAQHLPQAEYFERVWSKHGEEAFKAAPRIRLGTIHAAKGSEADTVHLVRSWGILPARHARAHPEDEGLVAYVGASRHRKQLIFEEGEGIGYEFP